MIYIKIYSRTYKGTFASAGAWFEIWISEIQFDKIESDFACWCFKSLIHHRRKKLFSCCQCQWCQWRCSNALHWKWMKDSCPVKGFLLTPVDIFGHNYFTLLEFNVIFTWGIEGLLLTHVNIFGHRYTKLQFYLLQKGDQAIDCIV